MDRVPLGLSAFALTTAVLSCVNAGFIVPSAGINIFIGLALFYGGIVQILAGMWEFKRGQVISATAFSSYGGFWVATAVIFIPGFGIMNALSSSPTLLHQAMGVYFLCWTILTGIFFLGALRTNIALLAVLGLLFLTYLFLTIGNLAGANTVLIQIGGWLGIATALVAWYTALADLLHSGNGAFKFSGAAAQYDPTCTIYLDAPAQSIGTLLPMFLHAGVTIKTQSAQPAFFPLFRIFLIIAMAMILLITMEYFFRSRRSTPSQGQYSQFLKSRSRRVAGAPSRTQAPSAPISSSGTEHSAPVPARSSPPVRFTDVAGIDEARAELEEVVQFLRQPERFQRLGAHIPGGILLVGPPGTGKTLLARAVAGEAGVLFFHMSASEFVEMFVGVGASRVRDLFQQARQSAPCVVFIDEIDAVGRKRSTRLTDSGERDQTLNQLLIELDGFKGRGTVVVLAATNRFDMLDTALLRPGRFDRHITISLPDRAGREAILRLHTRHTPLNARVRLDYLARLTIGMSGAELANLVNEAALYAARHNLASLTPECFKEALIRLQLGAQRPLVIGERERRMIAFHECGHALVAFYVPEADPVNLITLVPRGQYVGATQFASQEDHYNLSRIALIARIAVKLGGHVAVELAFGPEEVTTRAEDDLQVATTLAWRMVTHWGMGKQTGVVFADYDATAPTPATGQTAAFVASSSQGTLRIEQASLPAPSKRALLERRFASPMSRLHSASSPSMAATIDDEMRRIIEEGHEIAHRVLSEHYDQLAHLVDILMEQEQLDRQQFEALLQS